MAKQYKIKKIKTSMGKTLYKIVKGKSDNPVEVGSLVFYKSKMRIKKVVKNLNK